MSPGNFFFRLQSFVQRSAVFTDKIIFKQMANEIWYVKDEREKKTKNAKYRVVVIVTFTQFSFWAFFCIWIKRWRILCFFVMTEFWIYYHFSEAFWRFVILQRVRCYEQIHF